MLDELVLDRPDAGTQVQPNALTATRRFEQLQRKLLAFYGVQARSRMLPLARPRMRAHVLDAGQGEPILVFHGGDGEAVNWAPLMEPLQGHVRILAVDRPGFGLSDPFDYRRVDLRQHAADFVASLLDVLGLESATLMGGSMGGFFALAGALAHPDRVRRLVLVGYALGITKEMPLPLRLICGVPGLSHLFMRNRGTLEAQRDQYRRMFHVDPETVPELYFKTRIAGIGLPSEQGTWAQMLRRIGGLGGVRKEVYLGDELPRLRMPTLILWGEHDMAPMETGRAVAGRIPGGRFEPLPGIGHFPFLETPDHSAGLILDFLGTTG